jgi:hypothetical protein
MDSITDILTYNRLPLTRGTTVGRILCWAGWHKIETVLAIDDTDPLTPMVTLQRCNREDCYLKNDWYVVPDVWN